MNKHTTTIGTHLLRGAFFLSLFLFLQVLPPALGQPEPIDGNGPSQSTPTPTPCNSPYVITTITATIVPGTTDIGNHGDDSVTTISLPFPYTLYDMSFTSINLSSNGNAQFVTAGTDFTNVCLPWTTHDYTIFPNWDDLYLVNSGFGIFTSISGTAPNRIFNIEWRAQCLSRQRLRQLRTAPLRGADALRCDLRHDDYWQHQRNRRSAERRHCL